jgi:uncharacterized coiled-coil protein SlyX
MSHWCHPWYADCLSVAAILAMSLETRKMRKLAKQFDLVEEGTNPDVTDIFLRLHEACHHNTDLAKALSKDLDDRFRSTVIRVRSLDLKGIKALETNWVLPLLWAVLRDDRTEVRAHGRYLGHALLWDALHHAFQDKGKAAELRETIKSLETLVTEQRTEVASLRRQLERKNDENERLNRLLMAGGWRRETVRSDEPGKGRLIREVRKLRHDLDRERERTEYLSNVRLGFCRSDFWPLLC